jgi:FtsZ-interacting cell division protein ZipA
MNTILVVVIVVVVVAVIAALVFFFVSRRRRQSVRQEFGPEYERVAQERGSEKEAERELRERREEVESRIRPLSDESRRRYEEEWQGVEKTFVDNPVLALDQADRVVADILAERNFPTESRREAAEAVAVTHSDAVEDFRDAQRTHADATRSGEGEDLEKMRRAIQKYRSVYERQIEG